VELGVEIDVEKVIRIALLHDWAEVRVGDIPRTATEYFGAEARRRAETKAFSDIVSPLELSALYEKLYEEYEQRESLEAKLVKAADIIDLLIQVLALERAGARGLNEFWEVTKNPNFQLEGAAKDTIDELIKELLQARVEVASH